MVSDVLEGEILVKYRENFLPIRKAPQRWKDFKRRGTRSDSRSVLVTQQKGMEELRAQLQADFGGDIEKVLETFPIFGIQSLKVSSEKTTKEVIARLNKDPRVYRAFRNYRIYPNSHSSSHQKPPNDEYWLQHFPPMSISSGPPPSPLVTLPKLWGLDRINMDRAWKDAKVWSNATGQEVVVAVLDSGIDVGHPDLQASLWNNMVERNGAPGVDDDDNGYIDDVHGFNFRHLAKVGECQKTQFSTDLSDEIGHGTHVAGIIAAVGDNHTGGNPNTGIVGVNGSGAVKVMSLKIFCQGATAITSTSLTDVFAAIEYAYKNEAHVINASWALAQGIPADDLEVLSVLIEESNVKGVLFVTSAGNHTLGQGPEVGNNDLPNHHQYPANLPQENIIAVAATGLNDHLWLPSNWGKTTVHISAPGHYIYSTIPRPTSVEPASGTSMAAPFVAGCAAFVQSQRLARGLPLHRPADLKDILMKSGDQPEDPPGHKILNEKVIDGRRLNCFEAYKLSLGL